MKIDLLLPYRGLPRLDLALAIILTPLFVPIWLVKPVFMFAVNKIDIIKEKIIN